MLKCTRCGATNLDTANICSGCGVALGTQVRAAADDKRAKTRKIITGVIWLAIIVVLAITGPGIYHFGYGKLLDYRLATTKKSTTIGCGGPVESTSSPEHKESVERCVAADADLTKLQADYDAFFKTATK